MSSRVYGVAGGHVNKSLYPSPNRLTKVEAIKLATKNIKNQILESRKRIDNEKQRIAYLKSEIKKLKNLR